MDKISSSKVNSILNFVLDNLCSSFYVDKYKREKFDIKSVKTYSDFQKIPFLTKKEIDKASPLDRLFTLEKEVGCWVRTSGTTSGKPLLIPMSDFPAEHLDALSLILEKQDVRKILLLKPLGFVAMRTFQWGRHKKLSKYPLILGDISNLELTAKIASELEVDGIETTPSGLNFLLPFLKEVYNLGRIRFIRLSGEFTSEEKLAFFKSYFPNAYFDFDLGAMEAMGNTAFRCDYLNKNYSPRFYHPKSNMLFEVINEKGQDAGEESGELVLSSLFKAPFPLIRYKTGDLVSVKKFKCPCGRKYLMEIFGRIGHDSIRIGGITIYRHLLEQSLAKAFGGKMKGDYELHIYEKVYKNRLTPALVLKLDTKVNPDFSSKVIKNLQVSTSLTLENLIKEQVFAPLKIEIVGGFEKDYKKVKIISHLK